MTTIDDKNEWYRSPVVTEIIKESGIDCEDSMVEYMFRNYASILYYEPTSNYLTKEWIAEMFHNLYFSIANSYGD